MKKTVWFFLLAVIFLSLAGQYKSDIPVIRIYAYKDNQPYAAGNGFFINGKGYIATAWHIVDGADSIFAVDFRMNVYPVTHICGYNRVYDTIILRSKSNLFSNTFNMKAPSPSVNDSLYVIGINPEIPGMTKYSTLLAVRDLGSMKGVYQLSARIEEGFSGSPVIDTSGALVAMACYRGYVVHHIVSDTSFRIEDNEFTIAVPIEKIMEIDFNKQIEFEYWTWPEK